ncbi:MAG TPA: vitamin K epoxide reductase family protein [Oligoflexia bacterium]|nr:vitamin K epoxide reductase family protein [Oligoflexia bacterium]
MKFHKISALLLLVASIVSAYLIYNHYQVTSATGSFHSFCSVNASVDCDLVNASRYSEYFGIPVAVAGFAFAFFAMLLHFFAARDPYFRREALVLLLPMTAAAVIASIANFYISVAILKTVCLFCLTHQAISLVVFVLTILAARDFGTLRPFNRSRVLGLAGLGVFLFIVTAAVSAQFETAFPFDKAEFLADFRAQPVLSVPAGDSPRMGFQGDNPKLQLVEFADFECGFCGMTARHIHRLVKAYGDQIQVVFKNYPLSNECNPAMTMPMHRNSCLAAKAAICAQESGKFVEMAEKLFENQKSIANVSVLHWASEIGLNRESFETCLASAKTTDRLQQDVMLGKSLDIRSTPTFFVNGKKVEGIIDERRLRVLLKEFE